MSFYMQFKLLLIATSAATLLVLSGGVYADSGSPGDSPVFELKSVPSSAIAALGTDASFDDLFPHLLVSEEARLEELIGDMYSDYSMIASRSGEAVHCKAENFTHRTRPELEGLLYRDLLENTQGIHVEVSVTQRASVVAPGPLDKRSLKHQEVTGAPGPDVQLHWAVGADLNQYAQMPAGSIPAIVESFHDEGSRVEKITTFDVSCVSAEWSSDHRASLFQLRGPDTSSPTILDLQDPALDLTNAILQAAMQLRWSLALGRTPAGEGSSGLDSLDKLVDGCILDYQYEELLNSTLTRSTRHNTGNHRLHVQSMVSLECSQSCFAECRPSSTSANCSDSGDPSGAFVTSHKLYKSAVGIEGTSFGGTAYCGVAASCGVGECKLGLCGGEAIGASWGTGGFSFETSPKNIDELEKQGNANGSCTEISGPGCQGLTETKLVAIDLARPEERIHSNKLTMSVGFPLMRSVENRGEGAVTSWLVGEATVVSLEGGRLSPKGLSRHSPLAQYATQTNSKIQHNLPAKSALSNSSDYLLIAYPEHPFNSRHTTPPMLQVDATKTLPLEEEGRFIVSAFFEPDGHLRRVRLIQILDGFESFRAGQGGFTENEFFAFGRLVSKDLFGMLTVEASGEKQHAAVATAVLRVSDTGAVHLDDSFSYLAKCCCGDSFCL